MRDTRISPEESDRLFRIWFDTRDAAARERLIVAHLYIARIVAAKFCRFGAEYDDLYQAASEALVRAFDRYDPAQGARFVSFAAPYVTGEAQHWLRDKAPSVRLPRKRQENARLIARTRERLEKQLGRGVRVYELAEETGLSEAEILEALEPAAVPLDARTGEDEEDGTFLDRYLGAEETGYARAEDRQALESAMAALAPPDREILRLRYIEECSQKAAAERLGISQMTVSRHEKQALRALKTLLGAKE